MNMPEPDCFTPTAADVAAEMAALERRDRERYETLKTYVRAWRANPIIEFTGTKLQWQQWGFGYMPNEKADKGAVLVNTGTQKCMPYEHGVNAGQYPHAGVNNFPTWLWWHHPEMVPVLGRIIHFYG